MDHRQARRQVPEPHRFTEQHESRLACMDDISDKHNRTNGDTNIARALRSANRRSHDLITAVTSSYPQRNDPGCEGLVE